MPGSCLGSSCDGHANPCHGIRARCHAGGRTALARAAWWLSMVALTTITLEYTPAPNSRLYAWMVHAGVLLLLALRRS